MATANLGRIGFVNKGDYVGGTTVHKVNDIRKYNNSVYTCIQAHSTEHLPTDIAYWQVWMDTANYYVRSEVDNLLLTEIGTPIASASTTSIGGANAGDIIHITGTTTITSLGASVTGTVRKLIFDGALTITYNATSLILPGVTDMVTVAGSSAEFICENGGLGYWRCTNVTHNAVSMAELSYISTLTSNAQDQLNLKAPSASPTFTGTVVLPSTTSIGTVTDVEIGYLDGVTSNIQTQINTIDSTIHTNHIPLSGITAYHLISGSLALTNSVTTAGMATTLYTGNGTTQSIVTDIDMTTQWGNSASEMFGGLSWIKGRNNTTSHQFVDTVRGVTKAVLSDTTGVETTDATRLNLFNNNGFTIGSNTGVNANLATYASWNFQTTHRTSGTTNHGKAYTCHYNPFTGFTMVKYEGSGIAEHEIPHHLGRKLGFKTTKNLSAINSWMTYHGDDSKVMYLNETTAGGAVSGMSFTDTVSTLATYENTSANQYIMYGWADSYFDEANTLIGNYEIGTYQGTGATGNKVTTRGKPAWVMVKRLDSTGNWLIKDNLRPLGSDIWANLSTAETVAASSAGTVQSDGFTWSSNSSDVNASGGQYLYMVVYDNDSGSGKSKYPRATDTSALNLNAVIPFANGVDANGTKITTLSKNETVSGLTLTQGKNYVYSKNDGTYGVSKYAPCYGLVPTRTKALETPDFFDIAKNKWFTTTGGSELVTNGTFDSTTSGWTANGAIITQENGLIKVQQVANDFSYPYQSFPTEIGSKYKVKVSCIAGTYAFPYCFIASSENTYGSISVYNNSLASSNYDGTYVGDKEFEFTAQSVVSYIYIGFSTSSDNVTIYFDNISVFEADIVPSTPITESRNYLDAIVYADAGGQPTYIEQLPKIEYKDVVKANEYQGKNACTAWVNFDGTTTPPTIRDSFNVSSVVRTGTGYYEIYFTTPMDSINYTYTATGDVITASNVLEQSTFPKVLNKQIIRSYNTAWASANGLVIMVNFYGGKN